MFLLVSLMLIALLVVASMVLQGPLGWRARVCVLKIRGHLTEMTWHEVYTALRPGDSRLDPDALFATQNVFMAISNPLTTAEDVDRGRDIFQSRCSSCHALNGLAGHGGAPDLHRDAFTHGSSDWALYRNIAHGIQGTAMAPLELPDRAVWQVISFIRARSSGPSPGPTDTANLPQPDVSYELLRHAEAHPADWLMYSGSYSGQRYSTLSDLNVNTVDDLHLQWVYRIPRAPSLGESTPLVVDGTMYLTSPANDVLALNVATGEPVWRYERKPAGRINACCGGANRGVAILDRALFVGTIDAHLIALDATTGKRLWDRVVAESAAGYSITSAPLTLKDMVVTGVAGGDYATRGFLAAYDARTGDERWRFYTVPEPGEPGGHTWAGDSWRTGGGATWLTGTFDPHLNLIYWGVGNPAPDFNGEARAGDNLYTSSVVAIDADSGELRWYFQFTPHDEHDWDSNQIPVLVDAESNGRSRRLMLWANKNGFYYVLDRETGEFVTASAFVEQDWAEGIDSAGRPIVRPGSAPSIRGTRTSPGSVGGTNWWSPSFSRGTGLMFVPTQGNEDVYFRGPADAVEGEMYMGGSSQNSFDWAGIRAFEPVTGELVWEFRPTSKPLSVRQGGLLSTAGGVLMGSLGHSFYILDASSGRVLRRLRLSHSIAAAPITYVASGKQHVTIVAGPDVFTFVVDVAPENPRR